MSRYSEISKHISNKFGPISQTLVEIVPASTVAINIHIIPPSPERNCITLVTNGMSELPMDESIEEEFRHAELMINLPPNWPVTKAELVDEDYYWPFGWLRKIAHLPHEYEGWLDEGIIIPNGEPPEPFASNTNLSCFLISTPNRRELRRFTSTDGTIINFYLLIPIYEEERDLAINTSSENLLKLLNSRDIGRELDINRKSIKN